VLLLVVAAAAAAAAAAAVPAETAGEGRGLVPMLLPVLVVLVRRQTCVL
jgi:hypothetical protein